MTGTDGGNCNKINAIEEVQLIQNTTYGLYKKKDLDRRTQPKRINNYY